MPEIKKHFAGGRMNKDVDERLLATGEYRDAMNIQVSTSEGSDVGAAQNLLGNAKIAGQGELPSNASCLGSISDEKENSFYWLLTNAKIAGQALIEFYSGSAQPSVGGSWIVRRKGDQVEPVFVDVAYVLYSMYNPAGISYNLIGKTITLPTNDHSVTVGMTLNVYSTSLGGILQGEQTVVSINGNTITLDQEPADLDSQNIGGNQWMHNTTLMFSNTGGGKGALGFSKENLITGINVIDGLLTWVDGATEPKKINIARSMAGTPDFNTHTSLMVNGSNAGPIEESHVTVIKKSPKNAPELVKLSSSKTKNAKGVTSYPLDLINALTGDIVVDGETITFNILNGIGGAVQFEVGDVLTLDPVGSSSILDDGNMIRVLISALNITTGGTYGLLEVTAEIVAISDNAVGGTVFEVEFEERAKPLFELKFPRFALRYKYEDGEYSPVGPFTNVAFLPGSFDYHPTKAYNAGMINTLRSLTVENYVPRSIPKDVTQVDILYKNDTAPNIYIVKSVYKNEVKDSLTGENTWDKNSYKVSTENIYAQLPESQLLRPWDNVPLSAVAQEVVGSRVVYGNYVQGYDMANEAGATITPSFTTSLTSYIGSLNSDMDGQKSIKTMRTYDFGLVYADEYGRETPVFADSEAALTIPKLSSESANRFSVSVKDNHPAWAESYKIFIKETSNEYYNLALDRLYDAEDGNVWLSFPSVDRNKVDEETYLILKKEAESSKAVKVDARYKVVAIENEAPDFVKTTWELIGEPTILSQQGKFLYGINSSTDTPLIPYVGHSRFTIDKQKWNDPFGNVNAHGLADLDAVWKGKGSDEIYVFFTENERIITQPGSVVTFVARKSKKYLVKDISLGTNLYEISIAKPISGDESWITDEITNDGWPITPTTTTLDRSHPHFYRKVIENRPEFDGRFFVKIKEDSIIREKIRPKVELRESYIVDNSINTYYFNDGDDSFNPTNASNTLSVTGTNISKSKGDWGALLKFGGNAKKSGWFIDEASYAGADRYPNPLPTPYELGMFNSSVEGADQYSVIDGVHTSDFSSSQTYIPSTGSNLQSSWGTGRSRGIVFNKGIHRGTYTTMPSHRTDGNFTPGTNPLVDKYYLSLSYAGLNNKGKWGESGASNSNGYGGFGEVLGRNPELEIIDKHMKLGQRFRVFGADEIYEIKQVNTRHLYNYRGGNATNSNYWKHGNHDLEFNKQYEAFHAKWNRRVHYLIQYEILSGGPNGLEANTGLFPGTGDISPVDFSRVEFIDDYYEEGPNLISSNPAVFETEPKEDADLEVYYEATNSIPLELTYNNQEDFAVEGSLLEFTSSGMPVAYINKWGDGSPNTSGVIATPNTLFLDSDMTQAEILAVVSTPKPHLKFSRNDGSSVYANVIGNYDPYTTLVSGFPVTSFRGVKIEILPNEIALGWFNCWSFNNGVESNRIGDTYNKPYLTNGAKASTTLLEPYAREHRKNGLIYSGIYNSNSNTNSLNQFIAANKITKDINPTYGSIQKLHTRDSNLVVLCEDKILKITANKDALFNADGNPQLIATDRVLGTAIPFVGEFGISKDPESFASESYRAYFTDKSRGSIIRLSMDGITPISKAGMSDWVKDNLKLADRLIGSYDDNKGEYNLTLAKAVKVPSDKGGETISYREDSKGWVSFKSFIPENGLSCNNEYYTAKGGVFWKHHDESVDHNTFYGEFTPSTLSVILNDMPGSVKSFMTLNYEGTQSKISIPSDINSDIIEDGEFYNLTNKDGWHVSKVTTDKEYGSLNEFIEKEGKWFNYIKGVTSSLATAADLGAFNVQGLGVQTAEVAPVAGCTDPTANNFNPLANNDDNSCEFDGESVYGEVFGCMDKLADNYNSEATEEDNSCTYPPVQYICNDKIEIGSYTVTAPTNAACDNGVFNLTINSGNPAHVSSYPTVVARFIKGDGVTLPMSVVVPSATYDLNTAPINLVANNCGEGIHTWQLFIQPYSEGPCNISYYNEVCPDPTT